MSSSTKRKHSPEFKRQVVDQVLSGYKRSSHVARDFGLHPSLVHKWVRDHSEGGEKASSFSADDRERQRLEAELNRYKQKVGELTLANDALKKMIEDSRRRRESSGSVVTGVALDPKRGRAK